MVMNREVEKGTYSNTFYTSCSLENSPFHIIDLHVGLGFLFHLATMYRVIHKHMDIILLFFDHPTTTMDILYTSNVDKNGKFWTTYLPSVVNVVF